MELNQALEDIQQAMRLEGENSHFLDTRGYIRYSCWANDQRRWLDTERALDMA